jgi:hypothetical protein
VETHNKEAIKMEFPFFFLFETDKLVKDPFSADIFYPFFSFEELRTAILFPDQHWILQHFGSFLRLNNALLKFLGHHAYTVQEI